MNPTTPTFDLAGKVAIVTGAGRGIGRAIALRLAALGADVVIADVNLHSADEYGESSLPGGVCAEVEALGRRSLGVQGDLRQRSAAQALVSAAVDRFGHVDVLVNNAGGMLAPMDRSDASKMTNEDIEMIFDLNLHSTIYCSQAAVPAMRDAHGGSIVNIASMAALDPSQRKGKLAHYGMAKTSVVQFTRFLAHEVGPDGIRVNAIAPGTIGTARIKALAAARGIGADSDLQNIPLRRLGTADDIAGAVQFLATDLSAYVSGQCISVCGGRILTPS
jgi:NAD(P)-dependent dehydrogenase (short-subunit alcohol dehydrogenase family)